MALRKQSQPQPERVLEGQCDALELLDWPPDRDAIEHSILGCLHSGQWSAYHGPATEALVTALTDYTGSRYVRLVSSGTVAVELALRGCRIGAGDEVILAAFDYPGNLRSVEATGATPVLTDIAAGRWTVAVEQLDAAVTDQTRGVLVSHIYGSMADAAAIRRWADEQGIFFIEDACQTPGAVLEGRAAGTWGHVGTLSFGGSKLLSCGNGGAVLTDQPRIDARIRISAERPSDAFAMSQLQAAALLPQLERLGEWTERRRQGAEAVRRAVDNACDQRQADRWDWGRREPRDAETDYYKLGWFAPDREQRESLIRQGRELGLPLGPGFSTFARRAASRGRLAGPLDNSLRAAATTLVLDHRALVGDARLLDQIARRLTQLL